MVPSFVLTTSVDHTLFATTNSKEPLKHVKLGHTCRPTANAQLKFPLDASILNASPLTTTVSLLTKHLPSTPSVPPALEVTTAPMACTPERSDVVLPAISTLPLLSTT
jgi:hypothetical protein